MNDNMKNAVGVVEGLGRFFPLGGETQSFRPQHWKRHLAIQVYPLCLLLFDLLLIAGLFGLLNILRFDEGLSQSVSRKVLLAIAMPTVLGMYLVGGYHYRTDKSKYRFVSEVLIMTVFVFLAVVCIIYAGVGYGYHVRTPRSVVITTVLLFPVLAVLYRVWLTRLQRFFERNNTICIVGAGREARDVYRRLRAMDSHQRITVLSCRPEQIGKPLIPDDGTSPIMRSVKGLRLGSSMENMYVEQYILAADLKELPTQVGQRLATGAFTRNRVVTYEDFLEETLRMVPPSTLSMDWPLKQGFRLNRSVSYERLKRFGDICAASFGLVIASPVLLATAIAVKVTSKGPVLFKQERAGLHETRFMILKFRSMRVGAEKGSKYTSPNDARLTPIGHFIRKTRLDELPQLWNVLRGDLSLIGPRAEWVDLVERYERIFPYYHFRHAVKPGITGWAQVNYSYGACEEDTLEKLYYDLYYVRRYSLLLDVTIVVKTVFMMLFGRGQ